jgi:hypothetical protein
MPKLHSCCELLLTIFHLLLDSLTLIGASLQPPCRLAAENLFLRKQLSLYLERQVKPHRAKAATRLTLVLLSKLFVWREVLRVVKPETFTWWHRQGFPAVLEVEIEAARTATSSCRASEADRRDGCR